MSDKAELYKALSAVMSEVHALKKDEHNKHGSYNYVSVDSFKTLVRPIMAKHGLSMAMNEINYELVPIEGRNGVTMNARITFEIHIRHSNGSSDDAERITIMLPHTGAQTAGAARSYALKEYLKGKFLVSTGDKDLIEGGADADAYKPQEYVGEPKPVEAPQPKRAYDKNPIVKEAFAQLQKGINEIEQFGTIEDLALFWKNNNKTISNLPAEWLKILEEQKEEVKTALTGKVAA